MTCGVHELGGQRARPVDPAAHERTLFDPCVNAPARATRAWPYTVDAIRRVIDSRADMRYLARPLRPPHTEHMDEQELVKLINRDSMMGVTVLSNVPR